MTATRKPQYVPPSVKALTAQEAAPLLFAECKRLSAVLAAQWTPQEQVEALASECKRQSEQIQALRDELGRAAGWMEACARVEKTAMRTSGYLVRIEAARAALAANRLTI